MLLFLIDLKINYIDKLTMEEIKINKNSLLKAYRAGNADQKEILEHLYGKEIFVFDWRKITSYEKACEVLSIEPIVFKEVSSRPEYMKMANAAYQLLVICEAINGNGKWYDSNGLGYCPLLSLYGKQEIDEMDEDEYKNRGIHKLFASVYSNTDEVAGVGSHLVEFRSKITSMNYGSLICLNSKEKAEFVGKQFFELCCQCYGLNLTIY